VKVDASSQPIDTVQVFLDFDPSLLQVVDDAGVSASTVSFGPVISDGEWKQQLLNQVDNASGRIGLAAGKGLPAGGGIDMDREFVLAVINFKAVGDGAEAPVTIDLESQDSPLRSKALSGGVEVTGEGVGATINIQGTSKPPASASVSTNDNQLLAAESSAEARSDSTSGPGIATAAETRATPSVTPLPQGALDTSAASASVETPADRAGSGLGPVLTAVIIGGVVVVGLGLVVAVLFFRVRRSRQPAQSHAIPLGPARG
jgi:hypothetical protein